VPSPCLFEHSRLCALAAYCDGHDHRVQRMHNLNSSLMEELRQIEEREKQGEEEQGGVVGQVGRRAYTIYTLMRTTIYSRYDIFYILCSIIYILYDIFYILRSIIYTVYDYDILVVLRNIYTVYDILYILRSIVYTLYDILFILRSIIYTRSLYDILHILRSVIHIPCHIEIHTA
jgi:hypothetical protein